MIDFVPPWIEISLGGLGVAWALSAIGRARRQAWRGPQDRISAWGLLAFGALMVVIGGIRFLSIS